MFELELVDSSGLFSLEPKTGIGSANIGIRLSNGSLDYENPNHKKFILQVNIATKSLSITFRNTKAHLLTEKIDSGT